MEDFAGKLAVVTGGGAGMGRELVVGLAGAGCDVATCDIFPETLEETAALCNPAVRVTTHACDVSDEDQVLAFRDAVVEAHGTECVQLLFNNAGIVGGGSFVAGDRDAWERTFGVCWDGVYHCTRAFLPLLVASDAACIVNTSSINGFWASVGPEAPHTAYSTAKFAVKGFSEALIADLRVHAPHVTRGSRDAGTHRHVHHRQQPPGPRRAGAGGTVERGDRAGPRTPGRRWGTGRQRPRRPHPRRALPARDGVPRERAHVRRRGGQRSFSTECAPAAGASWWGRTPTPSTGWCARSRKTPTSRISRAAPARTACSPGSPAADGRHVAPPRAVRS